MLKNSHGFSFSIQIDHFSVELVINLEEYPKQDGRENKN